MAYAGDSRVSMKLGKKGEKEEAAELENPPADPCPPLTVPDSINQSFD